jgi:hypothetical protein
VIGSDPGDSWGGGSTTTQNDTLVRNASVCSGDPDGDSALIEWTGTSPSVITFLGDHTIDGGCLPTGDLFISEYVESTGDIADDILEIYNGTGASVDLSDYSIFIYESGSSTPTAIVALNNVNLADDSVFIIAGGNVSGVTENQTDGAISFNGDDAVALVKGYVPDNDGVTDDATCSRWATGPTGSSPLGTTGLTTSSSWFDQTTGYLNTDWNQVRYGSMGDDCLSFADQSGLAFDGTNGVDPAPEYGEEVPFLLGKFCHINNPIQADNSFESVHLNMTLTNIECDPDALYVEAEPSTMTFDYLVYLDETVNDQSPCPYGDTAPCADRIYAPQAPDQYFRCYYGNDETYIDYTVSLVGFIYLDSPTAECSDNLFDPDAVEDDFISDEDSTNCGCVFGMITDSEPTAIDLLSFEAQPTDDGVQLAWETANEIDNLGFNIYRSSSPFSLRMKINPEMIPSQSPGSLIGASYTFIDQATIGGIAYYYWLEDIDMGENRTSTHGPVSGLSGASSWRIYLPILSSSGSVGTK